MKGVFFKLKPGERGKYLNGGESCFKNEWWDGCELDWESGKSAHAESEQSRIYYLLTKGDVRCWGGASPEGPAATENKQAGEMIWPF